MCKKIRLRAGNVPLAFNSPTNGFGHGMLSAAENEELWFKNLGMRVSVSVSGSCNQSHTFNRTNLLPYNISLHVISFWHCKFTHLGEIEGISLNISASFSMFTYMFIRQSYSDDRLLKVWVFTNSTLTSCNYIQTQVNRSNIRRFLQI